MHNKWIILLIIFIGSFISAMISNKIAPSDFLSSFLWGMTGVTPGAVLLAEAPSGYGLIMIPLIAMALWRAMKVKQSRESSSKQAST